MLFPQKEEPAAGKQAAGKKHVNWVVEQVGGGAPEAPEKADRPVEAEPPTKPVPQVCPESVPLSDTEPPPPGPDRW